MNRFQRLIFIVCAALLCGVRPAGATYIKRYGTTQAGAMTFIGNTQGLNKVNAQNNPGTNGSIGAFSSTDTSLTVGTFPAGTTLNIANNSSTANLVMPAGSQVLYMDVPDRHQSVSDASAKIEGRKLSLP